MSFSRNEFVKYQAQTSPHPIGLEVSHAKGSYIFDKNGDKYLDFVAGVSACPLGHCNKKITKAITNQLQKYSHVMVYGEFIQEKPLELAKLLSNNLPNNLNSTYLVNSGTEAIEGALKLAKRFTKRQNIVSCKMSYHGNTQGSMSVMGNEIQKEKFLPLLPNIDFIEYNNILDLSKITKKTACVILETIQGGAGFIEPQNNYLQKVKSQCEKVGALMILDEVQTGFGRTGKLFGFENYGVSPDILVIGKAMGGGMPIGAFCSSKEIMDSLQSNPKLGHITTFGGHPVIAAAALETLQILTKSNIISETKTKEKLFRKHLTHPKIKEIRGQGLMLALILEEEKTVINLVQKSLKKGLILFYLLFEAKAVRITPALNISEKEIIKGCRIINEILDDS